MDTLQNILLKRPQPQKPKNGSISRSWQNTAFMYADKLGITLAKQDKGRWLKVFKQAHEGKKSHKIERAYRYLVDYPKPIDNAHKINLFLYIYNKGVEQRNK